MDFCTFFREIVQLCLRLNEIEDASFLRSYKTIVIQKRRGEHSDIFVQSTAVDSLSIRGELRRQDFIWAAVWYYRECYYVFERANVSEILW